MASTVTNPPVDPKPSITGVTPVTNVAEAEAVISSIVSALVQVGLVTDDRT